MVMQTSNHSDWKAWKRSRVLMAGGAFLVFAAAIWAGVSTLRAVDPAPASKPPALIREAGKVVIPEGSPYRQRIVVAEVGQKEISRTLILPAVVEADPARTANILPPVAGKVIELKVQLGDHVAEGQPLVVIDSGDLGQAYADDDKAREVLKLTKQALERVSSLAKAGGASIKDREQAESDHGQAEAEHNRTQARLKEIGASADLKGRRALTILAPTSGSVTSLSIAPGAYANDANNALMTISNLDSVWVTANAPENDVAFVTPGLPVDVSFPAYRGQAFSGKVTFVSDVLDPDTRRAKVRIAFANRDGKLKPNMFADAKFAAPPTAELFAPTSALLMNNDRITVFVEEKAGVFVRRAVETGQEDGGAAVIRQGLAAGERIVVRGGVLLND